MPVPQADPTNVARVMRMGIATCVNRLKSVHAHIEAKFLEDLANSIDMLQQQAEFQLDRPVEAMDMATRREFQKVLISKDDLISSIFGTPGANYMEQGGRTGPPPAIVGLQTMFILNLAAFCKSQGIPYITPPTPAPKIS